MIGRLPLKFPAETIKSIQLWLTITVLCLAPLFVGSVDQLSVAIWTVLLSISVLCGAARPLSVGQSRILFAFLALCLAYALFAGMQVAPDLIDQLNDPSWQRANSLLGLDVAPRDFKPRGDPAGFDWALSAPRNLLHKRLVRRDLAA